MRKHISSADIKFYMKKVQNVQYIQYQTHYHKRIQLWQVDINNIRVILQKVCQWGYNILA